MREKDRAGFHGLMGRSSACVCVRVLCVLRGTGTHDHARGSMGTHGQWGGAHRAEEIHATPDS